MKLLNIFVAISAGYFIKFCSAGESGRKFFFNFCSFPYKTNEKTKCFDYEIFNCYKKVKFMLQNFYFCSLSNINNA